jgi:hypothetical protein
MSFPALVQAAGEGRAIALPALGIAMTVRLAAAATGGQLCLIEAMFATLATITAAGPPDPAALAHLAAEHGTRIVGPPL